MGMVATVAAVPCKARLEGKCRAVERPRLPVAESAGQHGKPHACCLAGLCLRMCCLGWHTSMPCLHHSIHTVPHPLPVLPQTAVSMIPSSLTAAEFEARREELSGKTVVTYCTVCCS